MDKYERIEKMIEDGDVIVDFIIGNRRHKTKVVGFNLSIGATFISTEDPDDYIFCSHGKLSAKKKEKPFMPEKYEQYIQYMDFMAIGIEEGEVNWNKIEKVVYKNELKFYGNPSSETCVFNQ